MNTSIQPSKIKVALLPMPQEGSQLFGERWNPCVSSLMSLVKQRGCAQKDSSSKLGLFIFTQPKTALLAVHDAIKKIKEKFDWKNDHEPFPVKIILDLSSKDFSDSDLSKQTASNWALLDQEKFYASRRLRLQWQNLTKSSIKEEVSFRQASEGIYLMDIPLTVFSGMQARPFPHRIMSCLGKHNPCFYCGMNIHSSDKCPSKFISAKQPSIQYINQLSLEEFTQGYNNIFADYTQLTNQLIHNPSVHEIKNNKTLQVLISYLNIFEIFQLRFLWKNTFTPYSKWRNNLSDIKFNVDSTEFVHAFDALRLGKYLEADRLFADFSMKTHSQSRRFFSTIGRAFTALENSGIFSMSPYLRAAIPLAEDEKAKIYGRLLFARYCCLTENYSLARRITEEIFEIKPDCTEAAYLDLLLNIKMAKSDEDIFGILQLNSGEHYSTILNLLLDPQLLSSEGMIHEVLFSKHQVLLENAKEKLKAASVLCFEANCWVGEEHKKAKENQKLLESLEKQLKRENFNDLLNVGSKAEGLSASSKRIIEDKIEESHQQLNALIDLTNSLQFFWQNFSLKNFYKPFEKKLQTIHAQINKAEQILKKMTPESIPELNRIFEETGLECEQLILSREKMIKVRSLITISIIFFKKLLTTEIITFISLTSIMLLTFILPDNFFGQSIQYFLKTFERQLYIFAVVIIAPAISIFLTISSSTED